MTAQSPDQYTENLKQQALRAFAEHVIRKEADDRWLLQRRAADDGWDWNLAAEVIALWDGRSLFVGGDTDCVVFSYGPPDIAQRLRWIGWSRDLGYYVPQKASIGTGPAAAREWVPSVAEYMLDEEMKEYGRQLEHEGMPDEQVAEDPVFRALQFCRDHLYHHGEDAVLSHLSEVGAFDGADVPNFSPVPSPRVVYAWAAVNKLCSLLDQRAHRE